MVTKDGSLPMQCTERASRTRRRNAARHVRTNSFHDARHAAGLSRLPPGRARHGHGGYICTHAPLSLAPQRSKHRRSLPSFPLSPASTLTTPPTNQPPARPPRLLLIVHGAGAASAVARARGAAAASLHDDHVRGVGAARLGATSHGHGGGASPFRRDGRGVPQRAAQHVRLPAVRAGGQHHGAARRGVLPGAGRDGGLQPGLPLRAPLRRSRLLRHRSRLPARARATGRMPRRHPARHHMPSARVPCLRPGSVRGAAHVRRVSLALSLSLRRQPAVPRFLALPLAAGAARQGQPPLHHRGRQHHRPRRRLRHRDDVLEAPTGQTVRDESFFTVVAAAWFRYILLGHVQHIPVISRLI